MLIYTLDIEEELLVTCQNTRGYRWLFRQHTPIHHIHSVCKLRCFEHILSFGGSWFNHGQTIDDLWWISSSASLQFPRFLRVPSSFPSFFFRSFQHVVSSSVSQPFLPSFSHLFPKCVACVHHVFPWFSHLFHPFSKMFARCSPWFSPSFPSFVHLFPRVFPWFSPTFQLRASPGLPPNAVAESWPWPRPRSGAAAAWLGELVYGCLWLEKIEYR